MSSKAKISHKLISGLLLIALLSMAFQIAITADMFDSVKTVYLNNNYSGKYLRNSSSTISVSSGTLSALGDTIKWTITPVGDDMYTISSVSDTTRYLAGSATSTVATVSLTTLTGSSIPNQYKWKFSYASGGGVLIKNVHTNKYLYSSGSLVSSTSTLGTAGTSTYKQRVWRLADISYYGNSSSHTYVELPSGYQFETLYLFAGDSDAPELTDDYDNVMWRTSENFTFSGYSSRYVTYNSTTGKFTATSITALYSTTITATHKVTGLKGTFTLVVNPRTIGLGVDNTGHDHSSALNTIRTNLENCGYSSANVYAGAFTVADMDAFLDDDVNNVFVSRSHGGPITLGDTQLGTRILLNDTTLNADMELYSSTGSIKTLELSNMKLVMFIACHTGAGGSTAPNLVSVAVEQGARTAVGFQGNIDCEAANNWTKAFFTLMQNGVSVYSACSQLALNSNYVSGGLADYVICGYQSVRLN